MADAKPVTVCAPASSSTADGLPARLNVGRSLIGLTVMVRVCAGLALLFGAGADKPSSVRTTLNVAVPLESGAAW